MDFSQSVRALDGVLMREVGGEAVILNLNSERYYGLDDVGTRMWVLLNQSASIQAAYQTLLAEYDVSPEQLSSDLITLIEGLLSNGLVALSAA